jgi:hypothetical protein
MKDLRGWRLVGRGKRASAPAWRGWTTSTQVLRLVLGRCVLAPEHQSRLSPGLRDRLHRLTAFLHASMILNPYPFGGPYDRA